MNALLAAVLTDPSPAPAGLLDASSSGTIAVVVVPIVVAIISVVVGPIVVRHFRGPTPYDQLEKRVMVLEASHTTDERNFRIVGNGFDALLEFVGRLTDWPGPPASRPALSESNQAAVQLARNLRTYGQVDDPADRSENQRS